MSEIKRATLIPFGVDRVDEKTSKPTAKSVRLSFVLPESNEGTCPVYNYKEELAAAKKKDKSKPVNNGKQPTNGLDPFDEDDDDVRRIAQEMEAKYGMGPPAKKKSKGRRDDYADIGMGYDESDSFIDNTDGYDEMIPQNVTTLHGGFYINCGALVFKTDEAVSSEVSSSSSSSSSDEEEEVSVKASRKRVLETSESEGEMETDKGKENEKKHKSHSGLSNGLPVAKKKKLIVPDKIKHLKKNMSEEQRKKTVKDLLKEKREVGNVVIPPESLSLEKIDKGDITMKENKKPMSMLNVADIIECVAKGGENNNRLEVERKEIPRDIVNKDVPVVTANLLQDKPVSVLVPSSEGENSRDSSHGEKTEIVQLPENLPENILEIINKLKDTATKNMESNLKTFTSSVNSLLLSLERKSRCLGKHSKNRIYQHLAPFFKCRKETMIRRAKKLIVEDDSKKLAQLVIELKCKIDQAMPPLLENYDRESQKIVQKKFSREGVELEETKQLRMPKRKFIWAEEIKKLLKEIVTIRRRCYMLEGKTKDEIETQMNQYLKSDIQILWPDGWMSMTALTKIYNNFGDKKSTIPSNKHNLVTSASKETKPTTEGVTPTKDVQKLPASGTKDVTKSNLIDKPQSSQTTISKESLKILPPGTKEMQKLATNSMLSIIPVTPNSSAESVSPKPPIHDLTINKIDDRLSLPIELSNNSEISISPTIHVEKPAAKHDSIPKTNKDETTLIRAVNIDTLLKPITQPETAKQPEKTTKFINLPQNSYVQKPDWSIKPMKPPTDHKIENIIKPSKPENLTKPKLDDLIGIEVTPLPENLSKPKPENLSRPKPDVPKPKPELMKPKPEVMKPKPEVMKPKPDVMKPKPEIVKLKSENVVKPKPEHPPKPKTETKPEPLPAMQQDLLEDDVIILDDTLPSVKQDTGGQHPEKKHSNHHVYDLTHTELKRKPGPKSKTKYYDPALIKPVKSASALEIAKSKLTGNCSIDNLLQDNMMDPEYYYSSMKKVRPDQKSATSHMLGKGHNDGDDIQKVMEGLKVLQKMSTPARNAEPVAGAPVSVISFNKNYTPKTSPSSSSNAAYVPPQPKPEPKPEVMGFQDAFQMKFLNDIKNSFVQNVPTSSKSYNSAHSSSTSSHQDKYYMNANNNYAQQNASKFKSNYAAQQQGTFNLMDDMLANFISEYAYPKTANHKPKPPQK